MTPISSPSSPSLDRERPPVLASGDVLDSSEFFRRYRAMGDRVWAERIQGRVFVMPALRALQHGNPHALLAGWLFHYAMYDPDLVVSDNPTIRLDADNDPQPDLCLYRVGGRTRIDADGYLVGPPELIVEIAASSASYDFGEKRDVYRRAGVGEYIVYETHSCGVSWWHHDGREFREIEQTGSVYRSRLFEGLWLDSDALRRGDAAGLIETLRRGLAGDA